MAKDLPIPSLWCYTITHLDDDPRITKSGHLELGNWRCMRKMRPHVNKGDWVVAKLGKHFFTEQNGKRQLVTFDQELNFDIAKHLVYAMEVTGIKIRTDEFGEKRILCSKKGSYFWFYEKFIPIDPKYDDLLPKQQAAKKTPLKGNGSELAKYFKAWIKAQKSKTNRKINTGNSSKPCAEVCS